MRFLRFDTNMLVAPLEPAPELQRLHRACRDFEFVDCARDSWRSVANSNSHFIANSLVNVLV